MKSFTSAYEIEKNKDSNVPFQLMEIGLLATLDGNINDSVTTIPVKSTIQFPDSGTGFINKEKFSYSGKTDTSFTGVVRGVGQTVADSHSDGDFVQDGETLFLSDRKIEAIGQHDYVPKVLDWGTIESEIKIESYRVTAVRIRLDNGPWLDDPDYETDRPSAYIRQNLFIRIFRLYVGLVSADLDQIFMGVVAGGIEKSETEMTFICTDMGLHFDKSIGTLLTAVTWPSIDKDYVNMIAPIIIGEVKNQIGIPVVAGAATTLAEENGIDDSSEADFLITNTTPFVGLSYPLTVIIGAEEIRISGVNAGTSKLEVNAGGRGFGGTTASSHSLGDGVFEKTAITYKLAETLSGHPLNDLTNFRILPTGGKTKDAIYIGDFSNTPSLVNGTVVFDDPIAIARQVAIEVSQQPDQPITTQPDQPITTQTGFGGGTPANHSHVAASNVTITYFMDDIFVTQTGGTNANLEQIVNRGFADGGSLVFYTSFDMKCTKVAIEQFQGVPKQQRARIQCFVSSGTVDIQLKLYIGGVLKETKDITVTTSQTIYSTSFYSLGTFDWTDFNDDANNYIQVVSDGTLLSATLIVGEVWSEVQYLPGFAVETLTNAVSNRTTDAVSNRIADVQLGGDSVADSVGGEFIADIKGFEDDGAGTFTGTPNALIQQPADVIEFLSAKYSNNDVLDPPINPASFADITTTYPSFTFNFAIRRKIKINTLLSLLAKQTWARFFYSPSGEAVLSRIRSTGSVDKVLDQDMAIVTGNKRSIKIQESSLNRIANRNNIHTDLDYTLGYWNNNDAYAENTIDITSTTVSVDRYGIREVGHLFFAIQNNQDMADDLAELYKDFWKDPKEEITINTFLNNSELEQGDLIDFSYSQMGITDQKYQVIKADYKPSPSPVISLTMLG